MKTLLTLILGFFVCCLVACAQVDKKVPEGGEVRVEVSEFLTGMPPVVVATYAGKETEVFRRLVANAKIGDPPKGYSPSDRVKWVIRISGKEGEENRFYCLADGWPCFAEGEKGKVSDLQMKCRELIRIYLEKK